MEITLEAILSAIGLLTGGGFGTFFTWRYFKRKAKADAESAEAEAKQKAAEAEQARIEANKQFQEMYKTMFEDIKQNYDEKQGIIDELRRDRDHFKEERDELREKVATVVYPIEWLQLKELVTPNFGKDIKQLELLCISCRNAKLCNFFGKQFGSFS